MAESKTSRGEWLRPAFLAPTLLVFVLGFVGSCASQGELSARVGLGLRTLLLTPLAGLMYGIFLVVVDVVLWLTRLRRFPTGLTAWVSASAATVAGAIATALTHAVLEVEDETFAVTAVVLVLGCATAARLALGDRPAKPVHL